MSAAILAKTAKERANIAIRIMRCNKDPFTREMDNCFEMGDGDEVLRIVIARATRNPALMARVRVVFAADALERAGLPREAYQPKTGAACDCRPGVARDNCAACEGTGMRVDFKAIREKI